MHRSVRPGQNQLAAEHVDTFVSVGRARPVIRFGRRRLEDLRAQFFTGEQRCHSHIQLASDQYVLVGIRRNGSQPRPAIFSGSSRTGATLPSASTVVPAEITRKNDSAPQSTQAEKFILDVAPLENNIRWVILISGLWVSRSTRPWSCYRPSSVRLRRLTQAPPGHGTYAFAPGRFPPLLGGMRNLLLARGRQPPCLTVSAFAGGLLLLAPLEACAVTFFVHGKGEPCPAFRPVQEFDARGARIGACLYTLSSMESCESFPKSDLKGSFRSVLACRTEPL